jgi:hypothetical protein
MLPGGPLTKNKATMPTTTAQPPDLLQSLYAPISKELADVEAQLKAELRSDHPFVD